MEISGKDFSKLDPETPLQKVRSVEILHFLKFDYHEVAMILRVEFNEPNFSIEEMLRGDELIEVQLLEQEKENEREIYTYFIKAKPAQAIRGESDLTAGGGYFSLPFELKDGKVKVTFLGSAKQVKAFIKIVEAVGVRYRVVSLTDAQFSPHSLISRLTEKQQRAFIAAYTLGYYDVPKRIGLVQLAKRLNLSRSTLDAHLRKAEHRLFYHIINES
jgi:predicted DNA binding protein